MIENQGAERLQMRLKRSKRLAFPSSRGGVAARSRKKLRSHLCRAQTGWSNILLTTPSAPIEGCLRRYFLEVASTPPLERGIAACLRFRPLCQYAGFGEIFNLAFRIPQLDEDVQVVLPKQRRRCFHSAGGVGHL